MPMRSGGSHALAVLVCSLAAALIVEVVRPVLPGLLRPITRISAAIVQALHLPLRPDTLTILIVASALALLWGIFHQVRRNRT